MAHFLGLIGRRVEGGGEKEGGGGGEGGKGRLGKLFSQSRLANYPVYPCNETIQSASLKH